MHPQWFNGANARAGERVQGGSKIGHVAKLGTVPPNTATQDIVSTNGGLCDAETLPRTQGRRHEEFRCIRFHIFLGEC